MANSDLTNDLVKKALNIGVFDDIKTINNDISIINNDISTINNDISSINSTITTYNQEVQTIQNPPLGTYIKTSNQNFPSGTLIPTFDTYTPYSNLSLITQTSPTEFTINDRGLYYLEVQFNLILNGATWGNNFKTVDFNLNRGGSNQQISYTINFFPTNPYKLTGNIIYHFEIGDIISFSIFSAHTGTPQITGTDTAPTDWNLNTFFTWRLISKI